MKESSFIVDFNEEETDARNLKETLGRYLQYWPWFLLGCVLCAGLGVLYMRYTPRTFETVAKIKIIDDSTEADIATKASALLTGTSANINLDNEMEVLRSYRLLQQVVSDLELDLSWYQVGNIKTSQVWEVPFAIRKNREADSLAEPRRYQVVLRPNQIVITDEGDQQYQLPLEPDSLSTGGLPFTIGLMEGIQATDYLGIPYEVEVLPMKEAILRLNRDLEVYPTNTNSDILSLKLVGESSARSETILNNLIDKFNQDGILDRQLVSRRTLEVIDKRFAYLSQELDSIELGKQDFKQSNNLSYIEADADITLQRKSEAEDEVSKLENQISISKLLKETVVNQAEYSLLPADIGLENTSLNNLVRDYNELALQREKLLPTMGRNHPTLRAISDQLERAKLNIIKSVNVYQAQLRTSLRQLNQEKYQAGSLFTSLPEKEKQLRAIERQQSIKENLFLILLEKREEAAINLAATAPSIKVVDYALTGNKPLSPRMSVVYPVSLAMGVLLPFLVLFIRFSLDTKIYNRADLEKGHPEVPVVAEIPFFKGNTVFKGASDRSVLAESFRILGTNTNYQFPKPDETPGGKVIYVTSSIQGEGKTLVALNLSLSYASLRKKVLLLGADLRNPQLEKHIDHPRKPKGLSDYLADPGMGWKSCIYDGYGKSAYHKVCFSGPVPSNAPELLSGEAFEGFLEQARKNFDYIIVDTAPTLLVTDTFLISQLADCTLYLVRAGFTDKKLLEFTRQLHQSGKLKEMGYVLNEVGSKKTRGYNYGHAYGYGAPYEGDGA